MSNLAQNLFMPMLCNPRNQEGWPDVISHHVMESLHEFVSQTHVIVGTTHGKTTLPLPPADITGDISITTLSDKDKVHILEGMVITWARQIKDEIKADSEAQLKVAGSYPGPLIELDFWAERAANLNAIYEQLCGEKVQKVLSVLDAAQSAYYVAFQRVFKDVVQAREQANNNLKFLTPLRPFFYKLNMMDEFKDLVQLFKPIIHTLLLIWKHSKYYRVASSFVVLFREICNDLIMQAGKFVPGEDIMEMEPHEAVDKLRTTVKILGAFKSYYNDYKVRAGEECPDFPWKFQNSALFGRLEAFMERCHDVLDLSQTAVQFIKLDRVEIGGTKGKALTGTVKSILADFMTAYEKFQNVEYNIMEITERHFVDDFYKFRMVIRELERRLGNVIVQAFDDTFTLNATFKLLDSFEGLLERDAISEDIEMKHVDLLLEYHEDLKEVKDIFHANKDRPPLTTNIAPLSGAATWVKGLSLRIEGPMEKLRQGTRTMLEKDEAKDLNRLYNNLTAELAEHSANMFDRWRGIVKEVSDARLALPLLCSKDPSQEMQPVEVNFDPDLVCLLKEVKYWLRLDVTIPEHALEIYARRDAFRIQVGKLDIISETWNNILNTILEVERPLLQDKLEAVRAGLQKGLEDLNWNSPDINEYIEEVMTKVMELDSTLMVLKDNVGGTRKVLQGWSDNVMFITRKDSKVYSYNELQNAFKDVMESRHMDISDEGKQIVKLLSSSNRTLNINKTAPTWKSYVEYVSEIVIRGLADAIVSTVDHLQGQLDPVAMAKSELGPLLEVQLDLVASEIVWKPELGSSGIDAGVRGMFNSWIKRFMDIGCLMKRLDIGEGDYMKELEEDVNVYGAISELQTVVLTNEASCQAFRGQYLEYEYLYKKDLQEALQEFIEAEAPEQKDGSRGEPPLSAFEAQITKYQAVQEAIASLEQSQTFAWIKVDARPIKRALATWASKWVYLYTNYLSQRVINSMEELYSFMDTSNGMLDNQLSSEKAAALEDEEDEQDDPYGNAEEEGEEAEGGPSPEEVKAMDQSILYNIMGCMRDIRHRTDKTDKLFEPLKQVVQSLLQYDVTVPEAVVKQLEEAPTNWRLLKKKMFQRREALTPIQQAEAIEIRRSSDTFTSRVEEYRQFFLKMAPFTIKGAAELQLTMVAPSYQLLDSFHHGSVDCPETGKVYGSVTEIITESEQLREKQDLFELFVSEYVFLIRCKEELGYLKSLWDTVGSVMFTFTTWYATPWDRIDTDFLVEESKKLSKEIKTLNKAVRTYEVFRLLEESIKAMLTSLPLVQELHHPAMRDRHWKQLMKATGKTFVKDDKFSLGDLIELELHNYVDACSEIVDRAQKELTIEKALNKIEDTWSGLDLTFSQYQDTDVSQVAIDDAVTEALENDNLVLQSMSAGKYVQGNPKFLELVTNWQTKLGTVDSVLNTWLEVQKKWQALESIFIGSADIRVQLPQDSKRFELINTDFQDLMFVAPDITNVVEACNLPDRNERLDNLLAQLELCEKALQDYLETKRVAFPRFYFVAPADLLDILSKGSDPQLILRHLPKCFDNTHNLEFKKNDKGSPTKMAVGMYSGEAEYVEFSEDCVCDGAVETWLQNVVDSMRMALIEEFRAAVPMYDEKPRRSWLFDNSVQNTIVVSRMFYTQEVNEAFDELEEGNEEALKLVWDKQVLQLKDLIDIINGELTKNERKKLITLCTIDVHARDVVQRLIDERVESGSCFQWQSQLRYHMNDKTRETQVNICDAEIRYNYEYIGNCGCLCITPLTDRCYITLTQAQRLVLGGAPAGPAGTGKTETTKDLARALGVQCYVFNCSDQMDYKAMGQIYKGLAQTGAWGCFDEFNRIPVAVLSVCSTQYKTVLDAIRARKERFVFEDGEVALKSTVMAFITMNPGYPGRAELPESLKALFRPVSMCVPDLALICEIMLMAEGFQMSKILSRKFVILYQLSSDLLSKSAHYDWKLRAIKTTLYVAGGMKRAAPDLTEDKVLLRALRDFNLGKLTADDTSIFTGLLNDLFPKLMEQVPRAIDNAFETEIRKASTELGFQPDETFILKISQLRELFEVRWSVFLLGPAGCGKTAIWRTLRNAQNTFGEKTVFKPINPKAVTRNELYGYLHPSTREWREGLVSVTFRDFANNKVTKHQWIVLDGDIDAEWIESMNTVMDDNKMLTLASNERIPLTGTMRLLLEINHMVHCSPATVSRGGVIFVNAEDIGWRPVVDSWIEKLEAKEYRPLLMTLFSRYVDVSLDHCRRNFQYVVPLVAVNQAMTLCKILESILPEESVRGAPPPDKKLLEHHFVFACIWAFGSCMLVDKVYDFRTQFSKWWAAEMKNVTFPEKGLVFDYYVDEEQVLMVPWEERVPEFTYVDEGKFASVFVPTVETTRLTYFLDSLIARRHFVMFVGNTGTGKSAIMNNRLKSMDSEHWTFETVPLNSFSDAPSLQLILEGPLEKKSGVRFGPIGNKRLVYFIDDMNMPFVDKYDTQSAIELVRQSVDYQGWFDKVKILLKEILSSQYVACMNPTAGSFHITPRMQRHFVTFAVQMPNSDIVKAIYGSIIIGHMAEFDSSVKRLGQRLVDATVELHKLVMNNFLPSAVKFHYQFNLRDLSNITQGLTRMRADTFKEPLDIVRLWVHESERVFQDRMVNDLDIEKFSEFRVAVTKRYFEEFDMNQIEHRPNMYVGFLEFDADDIPIYKSSKDYAEVKKVLDDKLREYNENNATMDLVLFQQAIDHITRITRIIDLPRGNAMLVGVGGSGKQSLAKLASFLCGYEVVSISVSSSYGVADFKEALLSLYTKAGVKTTPVTFLMTDNQIVKEDFLVFLNDLLATGLVTDLFTQEDKDNFSNSVRNECKASGILDTMENLWDYFIDKVRRFLHVVLCFSPVGDKFRIRARQFPALVNCTVFDWFHSWPHEALVSVSNRFLSDISGIDDEVRENIAYYMAFVHESTTQAAIRFRDMLRRHIYSTPKSFLELISLYKNLLQSKRDELRGNRERLESGVDKIAQASAQVADLQVNLKEEQIIVEEKKAQTGALIVSIGQEKAVVDDAVEAGRGDEEACAALAEEVKAFQAECAKDLEAAEPVIAEATAALNSLDKASLGELKSFGSPAAEVVQVVSSCMVLTAKGGKIPKDLSWNAGKKYMGNVDAFLKSLLSFDKDNIPNNCVDKVEKDYISNPNFNADYIRNKSGAAAGLCAWVVNICKYFRIYQVVAPKRANLAEANKKLDNANKKLSGIRNKVKELQDRVAALEENLMKATEDKNAAVAAAEKTATKAKLADRLVNGLASENKRWSETIMEMGVQEGKLVGDVLLAASFVSYAGPFSMPFRANLVKNKWLEDMIQRAIPMTEGVMPLDVVCSSSLVAQWTNEGLPTDPLSVENGAIMTNSARWSLMIDPQLQGIKWITNREEPHGLVIIQQSQNKYIDKVIHAIEHGTPILIENLPDDIDAVMDPVVSRSVIRKGRTVLMKIGDNEVEYDDNFRLYLQTKLANPHYKPEINAQATLVNFCVTEKGLEDQLLALVVEKERPDLQEQSATLVRQLGEYTITLKELEDNLLFRLANSQGDILEDIELIENLEETKRTASDIAEKVELAQETAATIAQAREAYRPVATRGSLVYFLIDNLNQLDRVYHYSMANFVYILKKGMDLTPGGNDGEKLVPEDQKLFEPLPLNERVIRLIEVTSLTCFRYVAQGLFERHKLIMGTQLVMAILRAKGDLQQNKFDYLLRGPKVLGEENPLSEWISDSIWANVQALKEIEDYSILPDDLQGSAKRWKEWIELERPEDEPLPGDWKRMPEFERLLLFRALRPDRLTAAMAAFVKSSVGADYVTSQPFDLEKSFQDSSPAVPIFIFLSPGVDVAGAVEAMGAKMGFTAESGRYASVALGQGQEPIAMSNLNRMHKNGGWVLLQNLHLTIDWTSGPLEKKVDKLIEGAHEDFRLFLSAEPPPGLERPLPISLLQASVKLTNEPPEGLKPNLLRAYNNFNEEIMEACAKQAEFRSIIFALCYFHAALLERKKFGVGNLPGATSGIGWNMNYPFNTGDLLCCGQCANNYLENNSKVPWEDLQYIFGEIMYGGHIVEDWDRRLASAYLAFYFNDALLEGMDMFPKFPAPPNTISHKATLEVIDETMPPETPLAFGLHPNAEIGFKLREADSFCASLVLLQPRDAGDEAGMSTEERSKMVLDDVMDKLPDLFDMEDIRSRIEDLSPYVMVAIQESERMNILLTEMKRSLAELDLGLKGDLTMTAPMESLMHALADDGVPAGWTRLAYHSLRPLGSWLGNMLQRVSQLIDWTADLGVPRVVWISGLFNPQSFLTAVMQTTARRNEWPLDKTVIMTEVTKKQIDQVDQPSRDGAFIHGMTLEGARWDEKLNALDDSRPKELFCSMPVILIKAVTADKAEQKDTYQCPVYTTEARFRQEVFTAQLKSKHSWIKWTLAGVCMFLDVVAAT